MIKRIFERIKPISYMLEFFILFLFTVFFDVLLMARFDIVISRTYTILLIASASLLIAAIMLIKNNKWRFGFYIAYILLQLGLFVADSCLYYFKTDLISLAMLLEIGNALVIGLKYNIFVTFNILVWAGIFIYSILVGVSLFYLCLKTNQFQRYERKRAIFIIVAVTLLVLGGNSVNDTDQTLYKSPEDKKAFFQTFGLSTFHQKDAIAIARRIFVDPFKKGEYLREVDERWSNLTTVTTDQTGLFAGKNVIMIMCETCEMYAFDSNLTPNFNYLRNHGFNFNNTYSAAKLNYTYDSEFKSLVSQMYFKTDNYMYTLAGNNFSSSLPQVLKDNGYTANAFHNYTRAFFNRDTIYRGMGFDRYYASEDMIFSPHDYWSLDSEMFAQMLYNIAPIQDAPFFSFMITLTAHGPHYVERTELQEYYALINEHPEYKDHELSFKTLMAAQMDLDKGLGLLINHLEVSNLLDDTVIVFYSDHKNYSSFDMTLKYKELSDNPHDINKIPYLIFSNTISQQNITKYTSHYDMTPTILDLLGISYYQEFYYGESIFKSSPQKPIIFNYTSWMNEDMIVLENKIIWYNEVTIPNAREYQRIINEYIFKEIILSETILLSNYLDGIISYQN